MRLQRKGDTLLASVSHDGKEWKKVKPLEVKLGVSLSSNSMDVFAPRFDQFQLTFEKKK